MYWCFNRGSWCSQSPNTTARQAYWTPVSLKGLVLTSIVFLHLSIAAGLLALWFSTSRTDGIQLLTDNHYLWTYGPTTILVCLAAIWRQIDYEAKALSPWTALQSKQTSSSTNVQLDLVSSTQYESLYRAVKHGHISVVGSISGFVLLKLTILASTALFDARNTQIVGQSDGLLQTTSFNGSLFNATVFNSQTDSSLVYDAFGITSRGLRPPEGVGIGLAYETFFLPDRQSFTELSIETNTFVLTPHFNCVPAETSIASIDSTISEDRPLRQVRIDSHECTFSGIEPTVLLDPSIIKSTVVPRLQRRGSMLRVNCSQGSGLPNHSNNHQLLVLTEIEYLQTFEGGQPVTTNDIGKTANVTAFSARSTKSKSMICNPSFSYENSTVQYSDSLDALVVLPNHTRTESLSLPNFSGDDLASAFTASMLDGAALFGDASTANTMLLPELPNTMFLIMADIVANQRSGIGPSGYEGLLLGENATEILMVAADSVYKAVASQIVNKYLRQSVQLSIPGMLSYSERRLVVTDISLWYMFGSSIVLVLLAIFLWSKRPHTLVPHHPDALPELAMDVPATEELALLIRTGNLLGGKESDKFLKGHRFGSSWFAGPRDRGSNFELFSTIDIGCSSPLIEDTIVERSDVRWWRPFMLHPTMIYITLICSLAVIGALEAVWQVANQSGQRALLLVATGQQREVLIWTRTIPALSMVLLATMFNAIDFNIALLGPFNNLRKRGASISAIGENPLVGQIPLMVLYRAIRRCSWSIALSSFAALIGAVLTIVVSGLILVEPILDSQGQVWPQTEFFNTTPTSAIIDRADAAAVVSLLESANFSFPSSTYEGLAFPVLQPVYEDIYDSNVILEMDIPALQASLQCQPVSSDAINITSSTNPRIGTNGIDISAISVLPSSCERGGPNGNLDYAEFSHSFRFPSNTSASYVGKLLSLHVGPYDPVLEDSVGEESPNQPDNPPGCPSLVLMYGYADTSNELATSLTTLVCTQHLQSLNTHTFLTSSQRIINSTLLSSPKDTAFLSATEAPNDNITAFPFRIQQALDQTLSIFNQTAFPSAANADSPVDPFFQGVMFGRTGIFPEHFAAFASSSAADRDIVLDGIQAFYSRYMAQAISLGLRRPLIGTNPRAAAPSTSTASVNENTSGAYTVTVHDPDRKLALRINSASKLVLQGMLALMTLCMGVALWLERGIAQTLIANPCEIWGRLVLVVGGTMGDELRFAVKNGKGGGATRAVVDRILEEWGDRRVRLGWWRRPRRPQEQWGPLSSDTTVANALVAGRRRKLGWEWRWGIDFVREERDEDPGWVFVGCEAADRRKVEDGEEAVRWI